MAGGRRPIRGRLIRTDPATPATVSADGLPTAQINGVVWSQTVVSDIVYAGGNFTSARPPGAAAGTSETPRSNLVAYNINTGELTVVRPGRQRAGALGRRLAGQDPALHRRHLHLGRRADPQPDRRLQRGHRAADRDFAPPVNYDVYAVAATNSTVFAGGDFQGVGTKARGYLASFNASNGALLDWTPQAAGGKVWAIALDPDAAPSWRSAASSPRSTAPPTPATASAWSTPPPARACPGRSTRWCATAARAAGDHHLASDADNVYGGGYTFGGRRQPRGHLRRELGRRDA